MKTSRFLWKLYAAYVVLILLTASIVGLLASQQVKVAYRQDREEQLRKEADLLRDESHSALAAGQDPSVQERVQRLADTLGIRLTVILEDGAVIADSEKDPASMDNHRNRPEVQQADKNGYGSASRHSDTVNTDMLYVALPVNQSGRRLGYVRASLPLTVIEDRMAQMQTAVAVGVFVAAAIALLVGYLFARHVTRPLGKMTVAAMAIAEGEYQRRVDQTSSDEMGQLAQAFNTMASQLEERLRTINKDRKELLAILSGMVEGVIAVDRDRRVVQMNAAAGKMLQLSPSQCIGKNIAKVTRVEQIRESLSSTLLNGAEARGEVHLNTGSDQHLQTRTAPLLDSDGNLDGAVIVIHDVTELRRLEVVRRDFVANVSHELKTPITAIRGLIETVIDDSDMAGKIRKKFLRKIRKQSHRLSNLVTDLLNLSRLQSEESGLQRNVVDLREAVIESARELLALAHEKSLTVQQQLPEVPICVWGEVDALQQAITNLLDNAIKYTPQGGKICLRVFSGNQFATLEIEDTGIGIHPKHQKRIFERFYRVDKARSREMGGTGLGLAIVKHVCLSLGGNVSVESAVSKGSIFRMQLPVVTDPQAGQGQHSLPLKPPDEG